MTENQAQYSVTPTLVEQFASGWLADNGLAVLSVRAGEELESAEIIALAAGTKTLFNLVTLLCREQSRIAECAQLWSEARDCFDTAFNAWHGTILKDKQELLCYLAELSRYAELASERVEFYSPNDAERRARAVRKAQE
jgi:hypothetical protein